MKRIFTIGALLCVALTAKAETVVLASAQAVNNGAILVTSEPCGKDGLVLLLTDASGVVGANGCMRALPPDRHVVAWEFGNGLKGKAVYPSDVFTLRLGVDQQLAADGQNAAVEAVRVTVKPKPAQRAFGHRRVRLGGLVDGQIALLG